MDSRYAGRVAVVTGAGSGIGLGIARRLVAEGARVVIGDVDPDALEVVAKELGEATAIEVADVSNPSDVERLIGAAGRTFGRLDLVVANAGIGAFGLIAEHDDDQWRRVLDVTLTGTYLTIKHAVGSLPPGGSIVVTASLNATQPARGMAAYCAAKAGVAMLVQVAAMELAERGVRVNAVAPGLIETSATAALFAVPAIREAYLEDTTLHRSGTVGDVASVVAFLGSDDARFVSGSTYQVDGGAHTGRYPDLVRLFADGIPTAD